MLIASVLDFMSFNQIDGVELGEITSHSLNLGEGEGGCGRVTAYLKSSFPLIFNCLKLK